MRLASALERDEGLGAGEEIAQKLAGRNDATPSVAIDRGWFGGRRDRRCLVVGACCPMAGKATGRYLRGAGKSPHLLSNRDLRRDQPGVDRHHLDDPILFPVSEASRRIQSSLR